MCLNRVDVDLAPLLCKAALAAGRGSDEQVLNNDSDSLMTDDSVRGSLNTSKISDCNKSCGSH